MSEESIIVVGGGIAGLTGAALLAKEGYKVTLVEAHSQLGGCAGTFKRGSYTFDVGATQVAGLERGGIHHRLFNYLDIPLPDAKILDPGCAVLLGDGSRPINLWHDPLRWQKERQEQFPGSDIFWSLCSKIHESNWKFVERDPILPVRNFWDFSQLIRAIRPSNLLTGFLSKLTIADLLAITGCHKDRRLREKVYRAFVSRASDGEISNKKIIEEILDLRNKQAKLLGYKNWCEISLATKMADSENAVEMLLEELRLAAMPHAEKELIHLRECAKRNGENEDFELSPWDVSFWAEVLRKEKYDLDQEKLRPWFPVDQVLNGLFNLCKRLFEIDIEEASNTAPLWHEDVRFFNVKNLDGQKIASFYLDPFSRPATKRGGAWMDECLCRNQKTKDDIVLPVAYLVCNQTPPIADKPSLMSFEEVETLFHEFGHGLQHMLTTVNYPQAAGINNVEWDAVELASQFMENWCLEDQTISEIAIHWKTKEPLPESEINKLRLSRTFNSGLATLRQIHFALTDLKLHSQWNKDLKISPDELRREIAKNTTVMDPIPEDQFLCAFSHIFAGGYAAGYYSYKWAEVLSSDAFAAFEEAGLANQDEVRKIGKKYRDSILSLGGSRSPNKVFKQFRGRHPSTDALIRHSGLN